MVCLSPAKVTNFDRSNIRHSFIKLIFNGSLIGSAWPGLHRERGWGLGLRLIDILFFVCILALPFLPRMIPPFF
jgi:hypothetical protein